MLIPILATKIYIPTLRTNIVSRPRLIGRLNEGLRGKLTLISAPAGFGKTTIVSEWVADCGCPAAWLSLDEGDNDPTRFLTYLVSALRTITANLGEGLLAALQSPQTPSIEALLTILLNELITVPGDFVLVLDDYHTLDSKLIDNALTFLIDHLPPQMHLVITTREDPHLPLARLRASGQLTELRVTELRFTELEAAGFLNEVMGLNLSPADIAALETRTEGWIAGLQLAALSMQGHQDSTGFIKSFTGSHHFVLDYLIEEVLHQQPENIQMFLLHTSILSRMCGPLCDAVLFDNTVSGQETLGYLERSNLFIIPLDNERRWYRYHHLFGDLLRQRLQQMAAPSAIEALHKRASTWYETNGLAIEAFHHAAAAHDVESAARIIEGDGIPRHFRGAVMAVLDWLDSLPVSVLNARPSLWWRYAALLLVNGQTTGVQEKLEAAEAALQGAEEDDKTRHLIGRIATAKATLALTRYQPDIMIAQSRRALEYLPLSDLPLRANAHWAMGIANVMLGERGAAFRALTEAITLSEGFGNVFTTILATIGLGNLQEADNQLYVAGETYQRILKLAGDQPLQIVSEAHLGMARILYEWNDLERAEEYGKQSLHLARQYDSVIDRFLICEMFLARLKLAQGDTAGAVGILAQSSQSARQKNFVGRIPEIAAVQVLALLHQGDLAAAAQLAHTYELPISQARVYLAQGNPSAALALLEPIHQRAEAKHWADERLKIRVLQALAQHMQGEKDEALRRLGDALALAAPNGFIRIFVDEGLPMAQLLTDALALGMMPNYISKLLALFKAQKRDDPAPAQPLIEPLSQRELEILRLIADGLSNHEISARLFLALSTVKGHNQKIFDKLDVQRRTEAIARARDLGLL